MSSDSKAIAPPPPWALPLALIAATAVTASSTARFLLHASVGMELHELGHALVLWLGGRLAIPLPMVTLTLSEERSPLVWLAVTGLLVWLARRALRSEARGLLVACAVLLGAQLFLSLVLSESGLRSAVAFGGLAGEVVLGAVLIVSTYHALPFRAAWAQGRYVALAIGALSFVLSLRRWTAARTDPTQIPWGSIWGGDGDLEHLRDVQGWSAGGIVSTYLMLSLACGAAILSQYLIAHARGAAKAVRVPVRSEPARVRGALRR